MKKQIGFSILLIGGLLLGTFSGFYFKSSIPVWIFGTLAVLCILSVATSLLVIDMDKKEIRAKMALLRPSVTIPFADFLQFEVHSVQQVFITTNASLQVCYLKKGKEVLSPLAQGITVRSMQNLLNEIEEILSDYESGR